MFFFIVSIGEEVGGEFFSDSDNETKSSWKYGIKRWLICLIMYGVLL